MAMQNLVVPLTQRLAKSLNELYLPRKRNLGMHHASPPGLGLPLRSTRLFQDAVERPIDRHSSIARMPEHAQEPVFHRTPIEVFDNMQNSQDGGLKVGGTGALVLSRKVLSTADGRAG